MIDLQRGDMLINSLPTVDGRTIYFIILSHDKVIHLSDKRGSFVMRITERWIESADKVLRSSPHNTKLVKYNGK